MPCLLKVVISQLLTGWQGGQERPLPAHGELSVAAQALALPWSRPRAWLASAPSSRSMAERRSALGWASLVSTCHPGLGPLLSLKCQHLRLRLVWLSTVFSRDGPSVPDDGDLGHGEGRAARGHASGPSGGLPPTWLRAGSNGTPRPDRASSLSLGPRPLHPMLSLFRAKLMSPLSAVLLHAPAARCLGIPHRKRSVCASVLRPVGLVCSYQPGSGGRSRATGRREHEEKHPQLRSGPT